MKKTILIIVAILLIAAVVWFWRQGNINSPENAPVCGGIAGFKCPEGYSCKMTDTYPDAMGVCEKI